MGAYSNPETYIDTQSAQSLQRMQDTISSSFAKVADAYGARQKAIREQLEENKKVLKANDMKAQEYAFSLYTDLAKSAQSDPTVDWAKTYEPLIGEAQRVQGAEAAGKQFMFGARENREQQKIDRVAAQLSGAAAQEEQARADKTSALTGMIGGIASAAGSFMSATGAASAPPAVK